MIGRAVDPGRDPVGVQPARGEHGREDRAGEADAHQHPGREREPSTVGPDGAPEQDQGPEARRRAHVGPPGPRGSQPHPEGEHATGEAHPRQAVGPCRAGPAGEEREGDGQERAGQVAQVVLVDEEAEIGGAQQELPDPEERSRGGGEDAGEEDQARRGDDRDQGRRHHRTRPAVARDEDEGEGVGPQQRELGTPLLGSHRDRAPGRAAGVGPDLRRAGRQQVEHRGGQGDELDRGQAQEQEEGGVEGRGSPPDAAGERTRERDPAEDDRSPQHPRRADRGDAPPEGDGEGEQRERPPGRGDQLRGASRRGRLPHGRLDLSHAA